MTDWLLLVVAVLAGLGLWLLFRSRQVRRTTGLPVGRVAYVDTGGWDRCERSLFSQQFRLTGRPDYLVHTRDRIIPVEVKSGIAPQQPYPAHLLQLAAYCLLVEEQDGRMPSHGILKYDDRVFEVDYTPDLRARLLATLEAMRAGLRAEVGRDHREPGRCLACGYRDECDQRLA